MRKLSVTFKLQLELNLPSDLYIMASNQSVNIDKMARTNPITGRW